MTTVAVVVFVVAFALIATERLHRTAVALGGAAVLLLLQVLTTEEAFHSTEVGVDWNVILLLFGMMMIVAVVRRTGAFEYLAIWSAKRARGQPYRIMVILCVVTAIASALLDNVTTVLLVAPVTVLIAERLAVNPIPYLIAEAIASNIGGTATLVGDPPNIIIGAEANLSYTSFLVNLGPVVVVILVMFLGMARFLFRRDLDVDPVRVAEVMELDEREAITDHGLLFRSLIVLALVTVGFLLHSALDYEPATVALLGAGVLVLVSRTSIQPLLADVEWSTLAFFGGLFIMVGALVKVGVIEDLAGSATDATGGSVLVAAILILLVSGIASGFVDNIPFTAAAAPLVGTLTTDLAAPDNVLWWSLALGACLGGNATAVGASANVIVVGLSERAGHKIRFVEFMKYGAVVTAVSMAVSAFYLWIRYFLL